MDSVLHAVNKLDKNNSSFASSTNIKNYWLEGKLASNIRNYMAYGNYAVTNQIHVFPCIFTDVIIIIIIIACETLGCDTAI